MMIRGKHIALYVAGEIVGLATGCVLDVAATPVEIASMSRGKAYVRGQYSYTIQVDSLLTLTDLPSRCEWALDCNDRVLTGNAVVTSKSDKADVQGYAVRGVMLSGCGRIDWLDEDSWDFGYVDNMGEAIDLGHADNNGDIIDFL